MTFRDKLVTSSGLWGIRLFLLAFVYALFAKIIGVPSVRPEYAFVFFGLAFLCVALMMLPKKFNKEYRRTWIFFTFFITLGVLINLFVLFAIVLNQKLNTTAFTYGGYLFLISTIGLLITAIIPDDSHISIHKIAPQIKEVFGDVAKKLKLTQKDEGSRSTEIQVAEGDTEYGHIKLQYFLPKSYILSQKTSVSIITLFVQVEKDASLVFQNEALELDGLGDEAYKEVKKYISDKRLEDFNFFVKSNKDSLSLEFSALIEEESLWIDLIKLLALIKDLAR